MKVSFILTCAGVGARAGFEKNKLLVPVGNKTCLQMALENVTKCTKIDQLIITANKVDLDEIKKISAPFGASVVLGGATRTESVKNGLAVCNGDIVLIHDGARPFISTELIKRCIDGAVEFGGVIPVVPSRNTVCQCNDKCVNAYLGKDGLYSVQTPQAFKTALIKKAYQLANGKSFNDDGEVYKEYIGELSYVLGDSSNVKFTYPEDFNFSKDKSEYRFGVGFDCHKLVEKRKLILGGIEIPHDKGLLGHSDADVLTHAIMDAVLSACAMRDIGYHFPDTDPAYKGANSIELLKKVMEIIAEKGYYIDSIGASIMAEKPKLLKIIPQITKNLANVIGIDTDKIGITATTLEGLGFVGREEGICVHATATVKK